MERDKQNAVGEEGGINGIFFFLLIASCILLRIAGKVSVSAWTEIYLSISTPCLIYFHLSALCLDFYFTPSGCPFFAVS